MHTAKPVLTARNTVYRNERLLRISEVMNRTGLARSSIYALMSLGKFPDRVAIGDRAVAWAQSAIDAWIEARIEACCTQFACDRNEAGNTTDIMVEPAPDSDKVGVSTNRDRNTVTLIGVTQAVAKAQKHRLGKVSLMPKNNSRSEG